MFLIHPKWHRKIGRHVRPFIHPSDRLLTSLIFLPLISDLSYHRTDSFETLQDDTIWVCTIAQSLCDFRFDPRSQNASGIFDFVLKLFSKPMWRYKSLIRTFALRPISRFPHMWYWKYVRLALAFRSNSNYTMQFSLASVLWVGFMGQNLQRVNYIALDPPRLCEDSFTWTLFKFCASS